MAFFRLIRTIRLRNVGRLQTDADRERLVDGLATADVAGGSSRAQLANTLKRLGPRWFVMRDAHTQKGNLLLQPRWAMTFMRGPMPRAEIRMAREMREGAEGAGRGVMCRADRAANHRFLVRHHASESRFEHA